MHVSSDDALSRVTCQYSAFRSTTEKRRAFLNCGSTTFRVGIRYDSLCKASFSRCGSMQILGLPFGFFATTMLLSHGVRVSTAAITPFLTIEFNSALTSACMVCGTLRTGDVCGFTSSDTFRCWIPGKEPNSSLKTFGNSLWMSVWPFAFYNVKC